MPATPATHFQAESLRQRYIQNLNDALREGVITDPEHQWLEQVSNLEADGEVSTDKPRVDRLLLEDGSPIRAELANALLISSQRPGVETVYLDTLLYGLQRFDSRKTLLAALQDQFSLEATSSAALEYQLLQEVDPFAQRLLLLIDEQQQHLHTLMQELLQIPSLTTALARVLRDNLRAAFPGVVVDAETARVQIVESAPLASERPALHSVVDVQSLEQLAAGDFMGEVLAQGQQRQWMEASGRVLDESAAQLYQQALANTRMTFKASYEALLTDFWELPDNRGTTRRQRLAWAFAESFRQALLSASEDGTLGSDEFHHLAALLQPVNASLGQARMTQVSKLSVTLSDQQPFKLVGLFLLRSDNWPGLWLYSAFRGLRRFQDLAALNAHYTSTTGRDELLYHLSANDQVLIHEPKRLSLNTYPVEQWLFLDGIDSIIALHKRNLSFALDQPRKEFGACAAMIDDALDIRSLIDNRLLRIDGCGRWLNQVQAYIRRWPVVHGQLAPRPIEAVGGLLEGMDPTLMAWSTQVVALESLARQLALGCPDVQEHARQALNGYLAVMGAAVSDARDIVVQWGGNVMDERTVRSTPPGPRIALTDLLLERVTGLRAGRLPDGSRSDRIDSIAQTEGCLTPGLIDHLTDRLSGRFVTDYLALVRRCLVDAIRLPSRHLVSETFAIQLRYNLLYLQSSVLKRRLGVKSITLDAFTQVLTRPVARLRQPFGDDRAEVCFVSLLLDGAPTPLPMGNAFVVYQPSRSDSDWLLWSAIDGVNISNSLQALEERLNDCLNLEASRDNYLRLFHSQHRALLLDHLRRPQKTRLQVSLVRVEGHFIGELQRDEEKRQLACMEQLLEQTRQSHLPASLMNRFAEIVRNADKLSLAFDSLADEIQSLSYEERLPDWLKQASTDDLEAYFNMLSRYYLSNDPREDFLFGITLLQDFSFQAMQKQLQQDFPGHALNPDAITVKLTRYVAAPVATGQTPSGLAAATKRSSETLTLFAINHFSAIQGALLSLEFAPGTAFPPAFTPAYVDGVVRTLDVGQRYRSMLASKLDASDMDYPLRRKRFIQQMPSRMLMIALEMKLQGELSDTAYAYLEGLVDMPDGIARQSVRGQDITLRPLQLLPRADMAADTVTGIYLIGPKTLARGPIILHALFSEDFSFKEYRDQAHLLSELRTSQPLQTLVLGRVDPLLVKRYSNGGFSEAHIPWSTESSLDVPAASPEWVTLFDTPVPGNVLQYLFTETLSVFKAISGKQAVTTAQADWNALVYLMTLASEQIFSFIPGKLGMLIAAWQSQSLFKDSFQAAYDQHWGKALSEFSAALGALISSREDAGESEVVRTEPFADEAAPPDFPTFSWRNAQLTTELKNRLRAFEVHDVALNRLDKDPLLNIYRDPATNQQYAAVAGQVYRVRFAEQHWKIIDETKEGPPIRLNAQRNWELDLSWGLLGGGGGLSRMRVSRLTQPTVDRVFITESVGMREIRSVARYKARMIAEAHQLAIEYLQNTLFNLNPAGALDRRVSEVLREFFGVQDVDEQLLVAIKDCVTSLFEGLSDPSLSPFTSPRYVIGRNRPGHEGATAFVIRNDPRNRIHLSELYFEVPARGLNRRLFATGGFNTGIHFRATTLLHELSHLTNGTHDMAYLDAAAPFPDLLTPSNPFRRDLERVRSHGFSHRTTPVNLFIMRDGHQWRDFLDNDGGVLPAILQIAETPTLDQARQVFLNDAVKRRRMILKNADSLALLVTLLGRNRYSGDNNP